MIEFPAWFKPEEDAPPVFYRTEASVPKGWIHVPGSYNFQTGQWIDADPLDHDFDGEKGGSISGGADLKALRAAYKDHFGKKPFAGWDAETLLKKLG